MLAHLLRHDSTYGMWRHHVAATEDLILVDDEVMRVFREPDPPETGLSERRNHQMSIKETPRADAKQVPVQREADTAPPAATPTVTGRLVAIVRIATGLLFGWAFVDKLFGLGYATPSANAWISGGSPTKGFLGNLDHGPFQSMFTSWAGAAWADWLFMLGLAGIAVALLAGVGLRIAAVSGTIMMLLMWAAEWPLARHTATGELTRSTNPIIDYHIVYALVLIALAALSAGAVWGLGKWWANLEFVRRNRWLI